MDRRRREEILGQWTRAETPRERRQQQLLGLDLQDSPLRGRPLRRRLRNFRPAADSYVASLGGPLPWMVRLREIDELMTAHERRLAARYAEMPRTAWPALAARWDFGDLNGLIAQHNRHFPAESRLPMDPRTGDFALVNGKPYRRLLLGPAWILTRFPA